MFYPVAKIFHTGKAVHQAEYLNCSTARSRVRRDTHAHARTHTHRTREIK